MPDINNIRIIPARAGFTRPRNSRTPRAPDHPRSRGVYLGSSGYALPCGGSSPLARGLLHGQTIGYALKRIIPARAGFTSPVPRGRRLVWDHPRSRGVYGTACTHMVARIGSSPLARGLRRPVIRALGKRGIIPARAGFTQTGDKGPRETWDHPRSRGVYDPSAAAGAHRFGSSPLARGLQRPPRPRAAVLRIIPARAGFTGPGAHSPASHPDHPRSRGVYPIPFSPEGWQQGSSPLARGLPAQVGPERPYARIIPARAGFTVGHRCTGRSQTDHPRSRGVYPGVSRRDRERRGIIPARAGFTTSSPTGAGSWRDHPRSRGVYGLRALHGQHLSGSSPLARGLLLASQVNLPDRRIIPARAGFTRVIRVSHWCSPDHPRSRGVYTLL